MSRLQCGHPKCGLDPEEGKAWERFELLPEKNEMISGQLTSVRRGASTASGPIAELVGADRAVQLGTPGVVLGRSQTATLSHTDWPRVD
jgi:hypothetical protein